MKTINIPSLLRMKPNAIRKLGKYLRTEGFADVAVFWGEGIETLFGQVVQISFDSSDISTLHSEVVTSRSVETCFASAMRLPGRVQAIVAVGGGLAIDYCKHISHVTQLPLVVVPTVLSNDGFCSPFSSLEANGKRKTIKTRIPSGVIVDTEIIRTSPRQFTYAGIGDLLCKGTSLFDWKLAFKKTGEKYDDFAAILTKNALDSFANYPEKRLDNLEFLRIIASSLMLSGVVMEIAGSSRPASGSAHLISHAYDRIADRPSQHGIQVGVAAYGVSFLQGATHPETTRLLVESGFADFASEKPLSRKHFIEAVKLAPNIKEDFYTVLSEKGSIERLISFAETDALMQRLLAD